MIKAIAVVLVSILAAPPSALAQAATVDAAKPQLSRSRFPANRPAAFGNRLRGKLPS